MAENERPPEGGGRNNHWFILLEQVTAIGAVVWWRPDVSGLQWCGLLAVPLEWLVLVM